MANKAKRIEYYCETCGSDDIGKDARTYWNAHTQEWEFVTTYDHEWCNVCGGGLIAARELPDLD